MNTRLTLTEFLKHSLDDSSHLPMAPSTDDLKKIRKGIRKKSIPDISLLPNEFGYEGVGVFQKIWTDDSLGFKWSTAEYKSPKSVTFHDLCMNKDNEIDRLELGWMIANFARLDAISHLQQMRPISYEDHHQDLFAKQYSKQKRHFETIENEWRHWSIVPAGHMIL